MNQTLYTIMIQAHDHDVFFKLITYEYGDDMKESDAVFLRVTDIMLITNTQTYASGETARSALPSCVMLQV